MATVHKKAKYTGEDKVDEWLLSQVVEHVNHDEIGSFARDLEVLESVYSNIPGDKDKAFKVLQSWLQGLPDDYAVKDLINEIKDWIEDDYVKETVWKRLQYCVTPGVLPTFSERLHKWKRSESSSPDSKRKAASSAADVPQMFSERRSAKKHSTSTFHVESSAADDPTPSTSATPDVESLEPPSKKKSSVENNTASPGALIPILEDSHILKLSQYITSEQDLRELGTNGFGVQERTIDTVLYNHRTSINDAALDVLSTWRKQYQSSQEAYRNLQAGLKRAQMKDLAAKLQSWVQGVSPEPYHTTLPESQNYDKNSLQDEHVVEISRRIPDGNELMEFGIKVLTFKEDTIKAAMYDNSDSIRAATHKLLSKWLKQQPTRQQAYINLQIGLKRAQMNKLAAQLRKWVEGIDDPSQISGEQFTDLQKRTRRSIKKTWQNYLSNDWLRPEMRKKMPLSKLYTDLVWTKKVRGIRDASQTMKSMYEIIEVDRAGEERKNVLVEAKPGKGKTSSLAYLGMEWVKHPDGFPFDFVFIIRLRKVDKDTSLAQVIIDQHEELDGEDREYVEALLSRKYKQKVLLLLDGYDEYTAGTNKALDKAIESGVGNCFTILTSRPGTDSGDETYVSQEIRDKMDSEVTIEGFNEESQRCFCTEYFESEEESKELLKQAYEKLGKDNYKELLSTPVVLLMICVLYEENRYLPDTRTKLYETVREQTMDRTTWKTFGCKSSQIKDINEMTSVLGKHAWEALNGDIQQLLLNKGDLEKECPNIMKLGLLHEVDRPQKATPREQPSYLSFTHKSLQKMEASKYVTQELETSKDIKETLKELFPSWEAVKRFRQIITFTTGLMKDPRPLVQHIYEMQIEDYLNRMRTDGYPSIDADLFKLLYIESIVPLPHHPLHNEYINYYNHKEDDKKKRPRDTTSIYVPSRLLVLQTMMDDVVIESTGNTDIPECAMSIQEPSTAVSKSLLSTCFNICETQPVRDLQIARVPADICAELLRSLGSCQWLTYLDLSENSLAGGLSNFLPDPHPGLPSLARLELNNTSLNKEDVQYLESLIKMKKVPGLHSLGLMGNRLHEMEELEGLIFTCRDYHMKDLNLKIRDEGQPKDFETRWMRILEGKHVSINAVEYDELPEFTQVQLDEAYERALKEGYEEVFLARLNLVGFHEAGKTSLAKRLLGEDFDPGEQSTEGIALHYIRSTFKEDTQRVTSWNIAEITADDLHRDVMKNVASHLEPADPDDIVDKEDTIPKSTDNNQGQEHPNAKTTHEEDSHSGDHQDETAPPREEQELQQKTSETVEQETSETVEQETSETVEQEISETVEQETSETVEQEISETVEQETSETVEQETSETVEQETSETVEQETSETVEQEISETVEQETSETVEQEISERVKPIHEKMQETKHVELNTDTDTDENTSQLANVESTGKQNRGAQYSIHQISASMHNFSKSKENTPFTLRMWDLGGQNDFMTTHHLFLDVGAATLIVMDVTKAFDKPFKIHNRAQIKERNCCLHFPFKIFRRGRNKEKDLKLKRTNPQTPEHILHYWLNSFYLDDTKNNDMDLNVAIVLTHVDQIAERNRDKHIQNYKDQILLSLKGKEYEDLIKEVQFFEVDNKNGNDKYFEKLREQIFKMFKKQKSWGYKMPTRWKRLQAEILHTAEKVLRLPSLKTMASEIGLKDDEINSFLDIHNRLGNLRYFDQTPELAGNIITDPQWLVEKCKAVITHPEFIDKRKLGPEIGTKEGEDILEELKKGFVTKNGLQVLWNESEVEFLTNLMLDFDLFLPMVESQESNRQYLIPCMLPSHEEKEDEAREEDRVYLYDASQEAECGDWFKVGEFDKLLAVFTRRFDWKLSKNPSPSYGRAYFESEKHSFSIQLSLEIMKSQDKQCPSFRIIMYCRRNILQKGTQDIFRSFTQMVAELRKTKQFLHDRMGDINIKHARVFKVLCPNYDPEQDEYSTLIDAEEEDDGIIRISEGSCQCHGELLPSDQYTWFIQNVLLDEEEREKIRGFDAALLSGKKDMLKGRNSEVSIEIPDGMQNIMCRKIHTDLSRHESNLPHDESIIGPTVEVRFVRDHQSQKHKPTKMAHEEYLHSRNYQDDGTPPTKKQLQKEVMAEQGTSESIEATMPDERDLELFLLRIPHCLQTTECSTIKVRCIEDKRKDSVRNVPTKEQSMGKIPYFEMDSSHVIIHTDHFREYVCSSSSDECLTSIMAFPFGCLTKTANISQVKLKVYLCCSLFKIQDFKTKLEADQARFGRYLIDELNVPILSKDFDANNSEIALGLIVTDLHQWDANDSKWIETDKAFSPIKRLLRTVMGTHKCQGTCGKHYARPACEFHLNADGHRESFQASLEVQLYEATTTQGLAGQEQEQEKGSEKTLIPQEKEKCELIIKEKTSTEINQSTKGMAPGVAAPKPEDSQRKLNKARMLKLAKHINSELELTCLAIIGLEVDENIVDKHIKNNKEFNMAVYHVLKEWSNSIESPEEAYRILYEALGKEEVDMKSHRKFLE